ncbi:MAG: chorismate mutase [Micavibrio sp.]|nr:chorismate mutase [Micavibrio sp.]
MSPEAAKKLKEYREQIDKLDIEFIDVLARRFDVVRAVGQLKGDAEIPVVQGVRAEEVKERASQMGAAKGLDKDFVWALYEMMIDHAHTMEFAITGQDEDA